MAKDCVIWEMSCDRNGYAQKYCPRRKKSTRAVRVFYEQAHGIELTSEQHLLHSCDNPKCVNIEHVRVGTHQENMDDRKERNPYKGERNPAAKITDEQALEILRDPRTSPHVSKDYGITPQAVRLIRQGRRFGHLQGETNDA